MDIIIKQVWAKLISVTPEIRSGEIFKTALVFEFPGVETTTTITLRGLLILDLLKFLGITSTHGLSLMPRLCFEVLADSEGARIIGFYRLGCGCFDLTSFEVDKLPVAGFVLELGDNKE